MHRARAASSSREIVKVCAAGADENVMLSEISPGLVGPWRSETVCENGTCLPGRNWAWDSCASPPEHVMRARAISSLRVRAARSDGALLSKISAARDMVERKSWKERELC